MNKYIIYHKQKSHIIRDSEFEAKTRASAYKIYKKWVSTHTGEYFYTQVIDTYVCDDNGTLQDKCNGLMLSHNNISDTDYSKGFSAGSKDKEKRMTSDITDFVKTGHTRTEWYNLDSHILDDLDYNLPILIKKHCGYPNFISKIIGTSNDDECSKYWEKMLDSLLEDVRFYKYYRDFGIVDDYPTDVKKYLSEHNVSIPVYPGTENDIDYKKLNKLMIKRWNSIWDFIKKYGAALWD